MKTIALLVLPIVAACGRMGFEPSGPAPDASLDHLTCGAPALFSVGATTSNFGATATPRGYNVFTVDGPVAGPGDVRGFTYEFEMGTLVQKANDVALTSNASGPVVSIALGDQLLLAVPYGPSPTGGTQLLPLDAQLAKRPQPIMNDGWFGSVSTLAPTSSGTVAFLGQLGSMEVKAKLVSPLGVNLGADYPVIDQAERPSVLTILPTRTGFLVVWAASAPSPNEVRAELLDEQLAVTAPPITISANIEVPRVGYSAVSDTFTFAWVQKTAMGGDEIWVSMRDGALRETQHLMIGSGVSPKVIAGDNDFLVVWENTPQLNAARITADGKATLLNVVGSVGSKFAGWNLVVRNGQSAVAWVESGGTGPNLRIDPLCN